MIGGITTGDYLGAPAPAAWAPAPQCLSDSLAAAPFSSHGKHPSSVAAWIETPSCRLAVHLVEKCNGVRIGVHTIEPHFGWSWEKRGVNPGRGTTTRVVAPWKTARKQRILQSLTGTRRGETKR